MNIILEAMNVRWKVYNELSMYFIKPFVYAYLLSKGVSIGKNAKFYGFPKFFKHKNSTIKIGNNFECRSSKFSNPLGVNHPTIICTWAENSKIDIGNDVGITGGSIVAAKSISIGDRVLVGANSTIIDTDFHPTKGSKRYAKKNIRTFNVKIGKDCFIGMNSIILKGVNLKSNSIVPAGKIVR